MDYVDVFTSRDVARPVVLGEVLEKVVLDPRHPGVVLLVVFLPGPFHRCLLLRLFLLLRVQFEVCHFVFLFCWWC